MPGIFGRSLLSLIDMQVYALIMLIVWSGRISTITVQDKNQQLSPDIRLFHISHMKLNHKEITHIGIQWWD